MFGVKEIDKKEENACSSQYKMTDTDNAAITCFGGKLNNCNKVDKGNICSSDEKMFSSYSNCSSHDVDGRNNENHFNRTISYDSPNNRQINKAASNSYKLSTLKTTTIIVSHHHHHHHHHRDNIEEVKNISEVQSINLVQPEHHYHIQHQQQPPHENSHCRQDSDNLNGGDDDDDNDDNENYLSDDGSNTTDSEFSDLSGLSDISGQDWKPMAKPINWVQKQIHMGANPREILSQILSNGTTIAPNLNDMTLWRILASILSEPPRRQKLRDINTINDVIRLLHQSKNIIVLTGAGVSVSCGIPDFRSNNGIYNRLAKDFPDLPDPQAMFDINYFSKDPRPFYKFAREIYPGQFKPSPCHRFIKLLEKRQKLLRNYTQNIDTLEQVAGIKNVIECHGSFATASCTKCKYKTNADAIRDDIFAQRIPKCPKCQPSTTKTTTTAILNSDDNNVINSKTENVYHRIESEEISSSYSEIVQNGIMKPDIVFFGEGLPDAFHTAMASDKDKCDLLIVIGSSLKVRPVALIPSSIPPDVPQILINREQLNHLEFDVELLGDSDVIINHLCHLLGHGWEKEICWNSNILTETKHLKPKLERLGGSSSIDMKSSTEITTNALDVDVDSSSKSATSLTDGSNSPFCDSGFDSSSSHPVIDAHQQQQKHKNSVTQSFPVITDNENISLFNVEEQSAACCSSTCAINKNTSQNDVQIEKNCSSSSSSSSSNSNSNCSFLMMKPRHLSVDSSKDSGICDSLNTIPVSTGTNNDSEIYVVDEDGDSDDNHHNNSCKHIENKNNIENKQNCHKNDKKDHVLWSNKQSSSTILSALSPSSSTLSKSIADRLYENTYYHHPSKCSYVFPGAQVFWSSDSESENDDTNDNDGEREEESEEDGSCDEENENGIEVDEGERNDVVEDNEDCIDDEDDDEIKNNCIRSDVNDDSGISGNYNDQHYLRKYDDDESNDDGVPANKRPRK